VCWKHLLHLSLAQPLGLPLRLPLALALEPLALEALAPQPLAPELLALEPVALEPLALEPVALEPLACLVPFPHPSAAVKQYFHAEQPTVRRSQKLRCTGWRMPILLLLCVEA
jgi:hypothetical protein